MRYLLVCLLACASTETRPVPDDPDARPPVTQSDVQVVRRARQLLASPAAWNRADNRQCPAGAQTFSLYCALETATIEVYGGFEHRGAAMQEARFAIEQIAPGRDYHHRLMDFNNDPGTTFADLQRTLEVLENRIVARLTSRSR